MGAEFTFYDYLEAEGNIIYPWLKAQPSTVRAKLNKWLLHLEGTGPGQWKRPLVDTLTGHCPGLFEVRAGESHMQYRILGCRGPGERSPTLLHGFVKADKKVSEGDCDIALARKEVLYRDPDNHREIHRYD